jgi:hypothetical protein
MPQILSTIASRLAARITWLAGRGCAIKRIRHAVQLRLTRRVPCVHDTVMAGFLFAMLATIIAGVGARDQLLVARMALCEGGGLQGARPAVLLAAMVVALSSAAAAGWAGSTLAPLLVPRAQALLIALALGLAALELLFIRPGRRPEEPTASLGAFAIVLLAQQLTDAARLLVFVMAASSAVPQMSVVGGMFGCAVTVVAGWLTGPGLMRLPLFNIRRWLGLLFGAIALWLAL